MSAVTLSIPARRDLVQVVRSVAASIGASLNFSYDDIDDLRLAVDEACAYLLAMDASAQCLELQIGMAPSSVDIVATLEGKASVSAPADTQHSLIWHILAALTDGASLEQTERGPAIRFSKRATTG